MNGKRAIRIIACLLLLALTCGSFSAYAKRGGSEAIRTSSTGADAGSSAEVIPFGEQPVLRALVLHGDSSDAWEALYSQLCQSLTVNMTAEEASFEKMAGTNGDAALAEYDIVYLDSLPEDGLDRMILRGRLMNWTRKGGFLFLKNQCVPQFDAEFLGVSDYRILNSIPTEWSLPELRGNLGGMQELFGDYLTLLTQFRNYKNYKNGNYGYVLVPDTAVSLADIDAAAQGLITIDGITEQQYAILREHTATNEPGASVTAGQFALSTVNRYGDGFVLTASALLPNEFTVTSFTLEQNSADFETFINTTSSASQMFLSEFASFASKERYGYAVERLFGSDGTPSIAWQLHYEEETGIANDSAILFAELCEKYGQIPSYTLVRNTYTWFKAAETVTYALAKPTADGSAPGPVYDPGAYENVYDSGTHIVSSETGRFLEFASSESGSYFIPDMENTLAARVIAEDRNGDGLTDLIVRSSDGTEYLCRGEGMNGANYTVSGSERLSSPDETDSETQGFFGAAYEAEQKRLRSLTDADTCALGEWLSFTEADYDGDGKNEMIAGTADGKIAVFEMRITARDHETPYAFSGFLTSDTETADGLKPLRFGTYATPAFADLNGDGLLDLIVGHQEYGVAVPIDSQAFAEREKLEEQAAYIRSHGYYLGMHFHTTVDATAEQEREELRLHLAALASLGIDTSRIGLNQHTWVCSNLSLTQTFRNEWDAGILWNSGWKAANNTVSPEVNAENVWCVPFYFIQDGERTLLLWNTATVGYDANGWSALTAKYDLPVSVYYHCDLAYLDPEGTEKFVRSIGAFADKNGYRWVSEDRLAQEIAAAYAVRTDAALLEPEDTGSVQKPDGAAETGDSDAFRLTLSLSLAEDPSPLSDASARADASVRIELGEQFDGWDAAPVRSSGSDSGRLIGFRQDGRNLYVSDFTESSISLLFTKRR